MATTQTTELDQDTMLARAAAFAAEHMLPVKTSHVQVYDDEFRRICPAAPPFVVHVAVPVRVDVHRWAAVLGQRPETRHIIHEYDDGRWCAVWSELCVLPKWLPGVELSVQHSEDRWIAGPGRKS